MAFYGCIMDPILWIGLFGLLGVICLLLVFRVEKLSIGQPIENAYIPKMCMYDQIERQFLGHLVWAVGKHCIIFGKVRLAEIMRLNPQLKPAEKKAAYDKIVRMHVDFVLCDKKSTKVFCVIELYDPSAQPRATLTRAKALDKVCQQAGVPLLRFPRSNKYISQEIESSVQQALASAGVDFGRMRRSA